MHMHKKLMLLSVTVLVNASGLYALDATLDEHRAALEKERSAGTTRSMIRQEALTQLIDKIDKFSGPQRARMGQVRLHSDQKNFNVSTVATDTALLDSLWATYHDADIAKSAATEAAEAARVAAGHTMDGHEKSLVTDSLAGHRAAFSKQLSAPYVFDAKKTAINTIIDRIDRLSLEPTDFGKVQLHSGPGMNKYTAQADIDLLDGLSLR